MKRVITVIGGGPGGYVAAIRAAQLGAQVHLVEEKHLGGTCLNVGCIPTKALLHSAILYQEVKKAAKLGIRIDNLTIDWEKAQKNKDAIVKKLVRGVNGLLAANGITVHSDRASVVDGHTVRMNGGEVITTDHIILAVGSNPAVIPFHGHDLPGVLDSTDALALPELPHRLCILGGGVIGCEFAALFSALGVKVTIVEMLPGILPPIDGQISAIVQANLTAQGVGIQTGVKLERVERTDKGLRAIGSHVDGGEACEFDCEKLIVAVGRRPNTANMGLEDVGIRMEGGAVWVDEHFQTSVPGVYAIGDCNGIHMLAHAASAQGEAAVAHCMGQKSHYNRDVVPSCVYTNPEVAAVGLTEEQAKAKGITYRVGQFSLSGNGKSLIEGCANGMIKVMAAEDGTLVGAHMVGPRVTDIVAEFALAMQVGARVSDMEQTIHAHPTISEAVAEAAMDVDGRAIHWPPGQKA